MIPLVGTLLLLAPMAAAAADRIRPWPANPSYWQYRGQPVLLLGGSREDNLFQIPDVIEQLDLLVSVGGNYLRNTMSDRDEGNVPAFARREDGKFDLTQDNPEYWRRFDTFIAETAARGIIVQIEVWDRFDHVDQRQPLWQQSPWNPANNVNYTYDESGFAKEYRDHPSGDRQPFFHTIPGTPKYQAKYDIIRRYQERFVNRLLDTTLPAGNVLYCMNNETSSDVGWGRYWMRLIKDRAQAAGVDAYVTDMFDDAHQSENSKKLRQAIDAPEIYDFIEISQVNSRNFGEDHWRRILWTTTQVKAHPRPVNHTKIYSDGQTSFGSGTPQDGIERFWRNLLAGSASSRFHRPTSGIGLNPLAQACLKSARAVETQVKFWDLEPAMALLSDRSENAAYLAARPGRAYVLFFCKGGAVSLDLTAAPGRCALRWVEIGSGGMGEAEPLEGGAVRRIAAPGEGPWVAVITR